MSLEARFEPSGSATSRPATFRDYLREKQRILILLLIYSGFVGIVYASVPADDSSTDLLWSLPYLILGLMWCFADANQRGRRLGRGMKVALVLLFAFAFPIYLLQSRGIGVVVSLFWTALLIAAMWACMFSTALLTLLLTGKH